MKESFAPLVKQCLDILKREDIKNECKKQTLVNKISKI